MAFFDEVVLFLNQAFDLLSNGGEYEDEILVPGHRMGGRELFRMKRSC
jgi:hypothetical protein